MKYLLIFIIILSGWWFVHSSIAYSQSKNVQSAKETKTKSAVTKATAINSISSQNECLWNFDSDKLLNPAKREEYKVQPSIVNLDNIPPADIIAYIGGCGSWGDCLYIVLKACGNGQYKSVWGPDYAQNIEVAKFPAGGSLANLWRYDRTAQAGCDVPLKTLLTWSKGKWVSGPTCVYGKGVWDNNYCGKRPPKCVK